MFDWNKILSDDNYSSDPLPHWRAYDVLPEEVYQELLQSYDDCWEHTCQGVLTPDMGNIPDVWRKFAEHNFNLGGEPAIKMTDRLGTSYSDWFVSAHALSRHHHPPSDISPGDLIRDWHIDGESKYFNTLFYLGPESQGHIELRNSDTDSEHSYEYASNSMLVWRNIVPTNNHYHQFRNSASGIRRTVYLCWAPRDPQYINDATLSVDPGTSECLKKLTNYQNLTADEE